MTDEYDLGNANRKFIQISKKYGLNPVLLRQIITLRNKGYNNAEISRETGISRNTVNRYVSAFEKMPEEDLTLIIVLVSLIAAGAIIAAKIIQGFQDNGGK